VYVADTGNHRIQKFTGDGTFIAQWGTFGASNGQFNHPHGIAVDGSGNVYIAETGNNRIQKFSSDGTFITTWGSSGNGNGNGNGNGEFQHLHGLAVDDTGNVYAADRDQNRIQKFSSDGKFISTWGTSGMVDGQFTQANGVAVDGSGNVYVADTSPRIQKFTSSGVFIASFGEFGADDGQFNFPRGLSIDFEDNLYVSDRNNSRIQKFATDGGFIKNWGVFGSDEGQFNFPYAVATSPDGRIYVGDSGNHRIQVFAIPEPASLQLASRPVDMSRLERRLEQALHQETIQELSTSPLPWQRWWQPITTAAAAILIVVTIGWLVLEGGTSPAMAAPAELAQIHFDVANGLAPQLKVSSVAEANRLLADQSDGVVPVPELPGALRSCCLKQHAGTMLTCAFIELDDQLITVAIADGAKLHSPHGKIITHDGKQFIAHTANGINMVMAHEADRWLCVIGDVTTEELVKVAVDIRR